MNSSAMFSFEKYIGTNSIEVHLGTKTRQSVWAMERGLEQLNILASLASIIGSEDSFNTDAHQRTWYPIGEPMPHKDFRELASR